MKIPAHKSLFEATAIYVGTAVGAGIFGLPYAMAKFGFWPSLLYLLILTGATALLSIFYGEVVLRTKEKRQMVGYADKYAGRWGGRIIFVSLIIGNYGSLLAYTIGVGQFLFELLGPYLGGSPFAYSLAFFAIMSVIIFRGLKLVAGAEVTLNALFISAVILLFFIGLPFIKAENYFSIDLRHFFLPYGVILFAVGALSSVPLMDETLTSTDRRRDLKKSILAGSVVTMSIYLLFAVLVVGVTGADTSPEGIIGLGGALGRGVLAAGSVFGILTMSTSFLTLGFIINQVYELDYRMPHLAAWLLTCTIPLIAFLSGLNEFIRVIGLIGSVVGGAEGIIMILIWRRAKKRGNRQPEYSLKLPALIPAFLFLIFFAGIIYQIFYSFNGN